MANTRQTTVITNKPAHPAKNPSASDKAPSLADELLQLNDDFAEYSEISGFLCHAFANALSDHETLNENIISGAKRCSNWLQFRSEEIRDGIRHMHVRYVAERK